MLLVVFFFFKQKTAYEMRISDWSSDVCSSDLQGLNEALEVQSEPGLSAEERLRKLVKIRLDHLFGPAGHAHILSVSQRAHLSDMAREKILGMQREFRASCGALLKALRPEVSDKDIEFIFFSMQQLALYRSEEHTS